MTSKIQQILLGGIVATVIMSLFLAIAPLIGAPEMSPPQMLSMMMGVPIMVGWVLHFMIGIVFAGMYGYLFVKLLRKLGNTILKGAAFGLIAFVIAQIVMAIMSSMLPAIPEPEGSMVLMMIFSVLGHVLFGIIVAYFVKSDGSI